MATQEERLSAAEYSLDLFKTETLKAYQGMAFEITMVKGLSEDAVKRLATMRTQIDQGFNTVDQRLDTVDQRFDMVDQRLGTIEKKLDQMLSALSRLTSGPE